MWRYSEAYSLPGSVSPVSLGEGFTPLLRTRLDGVPVYLKLDYLQPSGSFKDRGASLLISLVKSLGIGRIVEDSSGNAGAAIAAYCAAAGIECTIFVPAAVPEAKLTQMEALGAGIRKISGNRLAANRAVMEEAHHRYYASHLWNPFFALGNASCAFEIWEQMNGKVPSAVVAPAGGGSLIEGLHIGFRLLRDFGYTDRIPRMIAVQAERCNPIHRAFMRGSDQAEVSADFQETLADGIAVSSPPRAKAVLKAVRESSGLTLSVREEEIVSNLKTFLAAGLLIEPTSAIVLSAVRVLAPECREDCCLILTGSGLKQTETIRRLLRSGL